ncbi:TPA: ArsC family reductase [Enterobacter hormaechei]|nr:ArsC family reductase [Enterobacter hormaechei]HCD2650591.1 ArsC family reductase [Enterobacter hormaechei]
MVVMYGIKNCDTIKKARRWLEAHNIDYRFHDYRADGLDPAFLHSAINELGWEALLNTRGTTWRKLDESLRTTINDADSAAKLMLEMPAIILRPLLCKPGQPMLLGFSETLYSDLFVEV